MKQASADGSDSKEALNNLLGRKDDSYKDTVQSEDKEVKDLSQKVKDDDEQENNEEGEEDVMPVLMKGKHRVKH